MSTSIVLTPAQVALIGIIAVVLAQVVNLLIAKTGVKSGKTVGTIVAFVVSVVLAFVWIGMPLAITTSDPMEFATKLIEQAIPVFAFATIIYNTLISKLFDSAGFNAESFIKLVMPSADQIQGEAK